MEEQSIVQMFLQRNRVTRWQDGDLFHNKTHRAGHKEHEQFTFSPLNSTKCLREFWALNCHDKNISQDPDVGLESSSERAHRDRRDALLGMKEVERFNEDRESHRKILRYGM
jgi:hypothetical protein